MTRQAPATGGIARLRAAGIVAATGNGLTGVILPLTLAVHFVPTGVAVALAGMGVGMMLSFARGGAAADTGDRVHAMVRSDLVRAMMNVIVAVGILAAGVLGAASPVAIAVTAVACLGNGLMAGYFRPAQSSLWAALVTPARLQRELQINSLLNRTGLAIGAAIGGGLIAFGWGVWGLLFDAATFLVTALLVHRLRDPRPVADDATRMLSRLAANIRGTLRIDREWRDILALTRRSSWMRFWFLCSLNTSWAAAVTTVAAPVVLMRSYTAAEAGLFQSIRVFALLAGALLAVRLSRVAFAGLLDAWSRIGGALSYLGIGLGSPATVPVALSASAYVGQALSAPSISAYVGHHFPDAERGRVYAAVQGVSSVLSPVGMLLGGVLMVLVDPALILVVSASLTALFGILPLFQRSYWTLSA